MIYQHFPTWETLVNNCTHFNIPPISTLVLTRAGTKEKIFDELFSLRNEFSQFRDNYKGYQVAIRNTGHLSLKELQDIRNECFSQINNSISKISKRNYSTIWYEQYISNMKLSSNAETDFKGVLNFPSLLKLADNGIELNNIEGKAAILFDVYKRLSDVKDYYKTYENIFNIEIQNNSVTRISKYSSFVDNYISTNRKINFGEH